MARTSKNRLTGEPKILPYDIIDVLEDREFFKHFLRRFKMASEDIEAKKSSVLPLWYKTYKDRPELMYQDTIDDIKVMLKRQESSGAIIPTSPTLPFITLRAVSDWVCEKEGRIPEREIIHNTVKTYPIPFEKYYVNKEEPKSEGQD